MKQEIKTLYKKDPQLAKEVAKVLGYKIKAEDKELKVLAKRIEDTSARLRVDFFEFMKKLEEDPSKKDFLEQLDNQY